MLLDLSALKREHDQFSRRLGAGLREEAQEAADTGERLAKTRTRFTPRSGSSGLAQATKFRVIRKGRRLIVRGQNPKPYAAAIDKGARPHVIRAKGGGMLTFKGRDGRWVSKKQIQHPGNRPYRFLHSATMTAGARFGSRMEGRMQRLAKQF